MINIMPELTPVFTAYEALVAEADAVFARVGEMHPDCVTCKPGCSDCCHAMFDLSLVEAMYLNARFIEKYDFGPERSRILENAGSVDRKLTRMKRDYFRELRDAKGSEDAMEHIMEEAAKARILEVAARFEALTGRKYGLFEAYRMEDAEVALVLIGSSAGTAKVAVDQLREQGVKAGLVKIRVFRPFPAQELAQALQHVKALAIMDKAESFSANGGPLFSEVRGALYDLEPRPRTVGYVYGLGGRDITPAHFHTVFARLQAIAAGGELGPVYTHLGQRG